MCEFPEFMGGGSGCESRQAAQSPLTNHDTKGEGLELGRSLTRSSTVAGPWDRSRRVPRPVPSCGPEPGRPERWLIMSVGGREEERGRRGDGIQQALARDQPSGLSEPLPHLLQAPEVGGRSPGLEKARGDQRGPLLLLEE